MKYNSGMGSFWPDYLEDAINIRYLCGMPYKIDKEKYNSIVEAYGFKSEIKGGDVITFYYDFCYYEHDNDKSEPRMKAFHIWVEKDEENCGNNHDCFMFDTWSGHSLDKFDDFVRDFVTCIIGPDKEACEKEIQRLKEEREVINNNIRVISYNITVNGK